MFASASNRSGWVIAVPGTTSSKASGLLLADESFRFGTNSYYHIVMTQNGTTEIWGTSGTASASFAGSGAVTFGSTVKSNGNVGVRVNPSSASDQYLTTGDAGIAYTNTYFGTGQVRVGGGTDHVANIVFSVAPGVINFDRPGVSGGAFKIDSSGNTTIGGNATVSGSLTVNSGIISNLDNSWGIRLNRTSTTTYNGVVYSTGAVNKWFVGLRESGTNDYRIYNFTNTTEVFTLTEGGNLQVVGGANIYRDLTLSGGTGGSYGNRLIIGSTTTPYTLQDGNIRPTFYIRGAYPVLTLDHTETSNTNHGPTIQFTYNGLSNRQWLIGTGGAGNAMQIGYSDSTNNTNYNPHNGISGYSGTTMIYITSGGNTGIGGSWGTYASGAPTPSYPLHVNGTAYATGAAGALSDIRHKTNIELSTYGLKEIMSLRPVIFNWNENKINDDGMRGNQLGFIAQEVKEILPSMILEEPNEEKTLGLKYNEFIPLLVKSVQELKKELDAAKAEIEILKNEQE
jgi:hypothetical protein